MSTKRAHSSNKLKKIGEEIRILVMEMSARAQCGETGSSLCISDILAVLYFKTLSINPKKPHAPVRDRFILSKGHAAAALYAALSLRGFFPKSVLLGHRMNDGLLHAHPSYRAVPGIEVSTGSLGHGLSIGVGMAEAIGPKRRVYVLVGDGECDEGAVWEAARYAGSRLLSNVTVILDQNAWQGYPLKRAAQNLEAQWKAAGWNTSVVDGHNTDTLVRALEKTKSSRKPSVVIARTVAGKDVPEIENTQRAHYYVPNDAAIDTMKKKYAE